MFAGELIKRSIIMNSFRFQKPEMFAGESIKRSIITNSFRFQKPEMFKSKSTAIVKEGDVVKEIVVIVEEMQ